MAMLHPIRLIRGYFVTLRRYVHTKKGAHDLKDYGRAMLLIIATSLVAVAVVMVLYVLCIPR